MEMKDVKVEYTDTGFKKLDELGDETDSWIGPENTFGDYMTVMIEKIVDEFIPEEIKSIKKKDRDKPENIELIKRWLSESDLINVFIKLGSSVI